MLDAILNWQAEHHVGDAASIAGLIVSIVGFVLTVTAARSSRRASERAEKAVDAAILRVRLIDDVVDFTSAIGTLEEIRRYHRLRQWTYLPDRYAVIRKVLVSIKASSLKLTNEQKAIVQAALLAIQGIEKEVERGLSNASVLDGVKFNNRLATHIDDLQTTLTEIKMKHAGGFGGKA